MSAAATLDPSEASAPAPPAVRRVLGRYSTGRPGPTVVLIGGMHGNEPAGARAIPRVIEELRARSAPLRGTLVGLAGNLGALAAGQRFLGRDLNRRWLADEIAELGDAVSRGDAPQRRPAPEDEEQRALLELIVPLHTATRQPIVFLDLHSTSGGGAPFTCMADVLRNRPIAFALPVPLILGIEETLAGSLLGYLCDLGHVAVAVEGGQNDEPSTLRHHEAAIWLALVAAGSLAASDVPDLAGHRATLAEAARGLPPVVEIRYRHQVGEDDGFEMEPGLANFAPVRAGQVVARDARGPVRTPEAGLMLMPRYQGQGDDGFFLARPVSFFWLRVSALLRRLRFDRLAPLLPGVRRDPRRRDHFVVDARIARFQVVNVFHLLGYRHVRARAEALVFSRRRPGFHGLVSLPVELRAFDSNGADRGTALGETP